MSNVTTLPPTLSVKDPDTRQFLDQLINVLDLRSGHKDQSSPDRFVTLGELTSAFSVDSYGLSNPVNPSSPSIVVDAGQSAISSAIDGLATSIQNSVLYQLLGSPIDLIDLGPIRAKISQAQRELAASISEETTIRISEDEALASQITALWSHIGPAEAAIVNESQVRSNKDNALASAINTMWASIGGSQAVIQDGALAGVSPSGVVATKWNQLQSTVKDPVTGEYIASAAIKTTAETAVTKAGNLEAKYTVKVDVNGYVSGFGLASTANNSTPYSDFLVRADRFAIAAPSGPGISPRVPFIVLTTTDSKGNPPGVYMDSAAIKNADIGTAKIGDAAVSTLKIGGNAVTISTYTEGYVPSFTLSSSYTTVCSTSISISGLNSGETAGTIVTASVILYHNGGDAAVVAAHIFIDGVDSGGSACELGESKTITATAFANLSNGSHTVSVRVRTEPGSGGASTKPMSAVVGSATIMSGKR